MGGVNTFLSCLQTGQAKSRIQFPPVVPEMRND